MACGAVVGAFAAQLLNYFYNLPRTHPQVQQGRLLRHSIISPVLCFAPALLGAAMPLGAVPLFWSVVLRLSLLLFSLGLAWTLVVEPSDKEAVLDFIAHRGHLK